MNRNFDQSLVYPRIIGDIGGTNARFALMHRPGEITDIRVLPCADYPSIRDAVAAYLAGLDADVRLGVIAIANPVDGDEIRMTNHHWTFSVKALAASLGFAHLIVVNDFMALARAVPGLRSDEFVRLGETGAARHGVIGVIGPGTGLGVSYLVPVRNGWQAQATEGGHISLAPTGPRESAVLDALRMQYAHISAERLLSGLGLPVLYRALCQLDGVVAQPLEASGLVRKAVESGDPQAIETFALFSHWLGSVAGNLALTLGCQGGVYLGGGVIARLGDLFDVERFRRGFEAKGRFSNYLRQIPTFLVTAEFPALSGAAALLDVHLEAEALPSQPLV